MIENIVQVGLPVVAGLIVIVVIIAIIDRPRQRKMRGETPRSPSGDGP